jgi:hypothetical protein
MRYGVKILETGREVVELPDDAQISRFGGVGCIQCIFDTREDAEEYIDEIEGDFAPDESMDGDHASAMASAGMGTDEDYGYFGDPEVCGE